MKCTELLVLNLPSIIYCGNTKCC